MLIYCCLSERNIAFNANDKGILFASVIGGEGSENIEFVCLSLKEMAAVTSPLRIIQPGAQMSELTGKKKERNLRLWWGRFSHAMMLLFKLRQPVEYQSWAGISGIKNVKVESFLDQVVDFIRKFLEETSGQDGRLCRFFTSDNLKYQIYEPSVEALGLRTRDVR